MRSARTYWEEIVKRGELVVPLSLLVVGIFLFYLATQLPTPVRFAPAVGPAVFPEIVLSVIVILSAKLIYSYVRVGKLQEPLRPVTEVENPKNFWITLVFLTLYVFLLDILGFVVLTPIWVGTYMYIIGVRRWKILVASTSILSALVIITFPVLFLVPLPRGIGIFRAISLLVY